MRKKYDFMVEIGKSCKRIRCAALLTQEQMAKRCKCSRQHICDFEHGKSKSERIYKEYITLYKTLRDNGEGTL